LIAFVYLVLALAASAGLCHVSFPSLQVHMARIFVAWVLVYAALFFSPHPAIFMFGVAAIFWRMLPRNWPERALYYCALLPAAPIGIGWVVPFPGINRLYTLDYVEVLTLVALMPIVFARKSELASLQAPSAALRRVVLLGCLYVVLAIILDFRLTTITNGLRLGVVHILATAIPVIAFARIARAHGAFEAITSGLLVASVFVAFIGFTQVFLGWYLFSEVSPSLELGEFQYDILMMNRGSGLRMPATLNPIPTGMLLAVGIVLVCMRLWSNDARRPAWLVIGLLSYGVIQTEARGAMFLLIVGLAIISLHLPFLSKGRRVLTVSALMLLFSSLLFTDLFQWILEADEYGTFRYRWELVLNSMGSITAHPFFGTPNFIEHPQLELSRNGAGEIDIVNAYLYFVLRYGLVGLFLFASPIAFAIGRAIKARREAELSGQRIPERKLRCFLAILVGYLVAIITVSLLSILPQLYWILLVLAAALTKLDVVPAPTTPKPARMTYRNAYR
jgi:hypothetical protein